MLYANWWKLVHVLDTYKAVAVSHQEADTGGCSVTKVAGWCQKLATGAEVEKLAGIKDH